MTPRLLRCSNLNSRIARANRTSASLSSFNAAQLLLNGISFWLSGWSAAQSGQRGIRAGEPAALRPGAPVFPCCANRRLAPRLPHRWTAESGRWPPANPLNRFARRMPCCLLQTTSHCLPRNKTAYFLNCPAKCNSPRRNWRTRSRCWGARWRHIHWVVEHKAQVSCNSPTNLLQAPIS